MEDGKLRYQLRRKALCIALGMCVAGAVQAQSVTGSIHGNTGGAGDTVVIENLDTGSRLSVTPDANGRFNATTVPSGRYRVTLKRGDSNVATSEVRVIVGQGVLADLATGGASTLDAVTVVGSAYGGIDVT